MRIEYDGSWKRYVGQVNALTATFIATTAAATTTTTTTTTATTYNNIIIIIIFPF